MHAFALMLVEKHVWYAWEQLLFADSQSRTVPLAAVGPVAWSEGARMAELIAAGRIQDDAEAT